MLKIHYAVCGCYPEDVRIVGLFDVRTAGIENVVAGSLIHELAS